MNNRPLTPLWIRRQLLARKIRKACPDAPQLETLQTIHWYIGTERKRLGAAQRNYEETRRELIDAGMDTTGLLPPTVPALFSEAVDLEESKREEVFWKDEYIRLHACVEDLLAQIKDMEADRVKLIEQAQFWQNLFEQQRELSSEMIDQNANLVEEKFNQLLSSLPENRRN